MPAVHLFQGVGDLSYRGFRPGGVNGQGEQVVLRTSAGRCRRPRQFGQRGLHRRLIAICTQVQQFGELFGSDPAVLHFQNVDVRILIHLVLVHADHRLLSGVDARLGSRGGLFDTQLGNTVADGLRHAPALGNLRDMSAGTLRQLMCQPLDVVGAGPGIDRSRGAGFLLKQ